MPRFAANLSMLFTELPFLDRFAAARAAGFRAVEYLFPYDYPKEELAARLRGEGLRQVLHNLPAGDWAAGERGIACDPRRTEEFRKGVLVGTPEQLVETLKHLETLGMTYAITYFAEAAYDRSGIELFEREVVPALR